MADYPALAFHLKSALNAAFKTPADETLDALIAGESDSDPAYAALKFVALHLAWSTRNEAMRRVDKIVVWKDVVHWSGVFEAHVHILSDKRSRRGVYVQFTPSSFTTIVKILPQNIKKDGTFASELYDWSIEANPFSAVDGKFITDGKTTYKLRPNPLRPLRGREVDYMDPEETEVET